MNQIKAVLEKSEFSREPHLTIHVDGTPLDRLLHRAYPDRYFNGLVPALLDWIQWEQERAIVWERVESTQQQVVPLLMCPDDCDLYCTVINVEVLKTEQKVQWLRLGLDKGGAEGMPASIGTTVEWFDKVGPFEFERPAYDACIATFKDEIEKDNVYRRFEKWIKEIEEDEKVPSSIQAVNVSILNYVDGYLLFLSGAEDYSTKNDDWIEVHDFTPYDPTLSLGEYSLRWDEQEILQIVKNALERFAQLEMYPRSFVHKAAYFTTGIEGGPRIRIEKGG